MAYLERKLKEDNSLPLKRRILEGMYNTRFASPVRMVKPELVEPKFPTVKRCTRRNIPETTTLQNVSDLHGYGKLSAMGTHE